MCLTSVRKIPCQSVKLHTPRSEMSEIFVRDLDCRLRGGERDYKSYRAAPRPLPPQTQTREPPVPGHQDRVGAQSLYCIDHFSFRFTIAQVRRLYRGFKSECPSGILTEECFHYVYSSFFPGARLNLMRSFDPLLMSRERHELHRVHLLLLALHLLPHGEQVRIYHFRGSHSHLLKNSIGKNCPGFFNESFHHRDWN